MTENFFGGEWKDLNGGIFAGSLTILPGLVLLRVKKSALKYNFKQHFGGSPLSPFTLEVWAQSAIAS